MSYKCNRCHKVASTRSGIRCGRCDSSTAAQQGVAQIYPQPVFIEVYDSPHRIESSGSFTSGGGGDFGGGGASGSYDSGSSSSGTD